MHINNIMSSDTYSCTLDTTLDKIAIMMWENDCGATPIVDGKNRPIGMITDRDIAIGAALKSKALWQITADEINNARPVFTCKLDDEISGVLKIMQAEKIRRIPVVNNRAELSGMVSIGDIAAFSEQKRSADIPYKDTMATLKAVATHHDAKARPVATA